MNAGIRTCARLRFDREHFGGGQHWPRAKPGITPRRAPRIGCRRCATHAFVASEVAPKRVCSRFCSCALLDWNDEPFGLSRARDAAFGDADGRPTRPSTREVCMTPRTSRSARMAFVTLGDAMELAHSRLRLEILAVIARGPLDVSSLSSCLDLEVSYVSRNVHKLAQAGYVVVAREGQRRRVCSLGPAASVTTKPDGAGMLTLKADDGNAMHLELTEPTLAELSHRDPTPSAIKKGPAGSSPAHRASAPSDLRPPSERAAG
jgi:DNA-binding transcriptional ArsR family regulator